MIRSRTLTLSLLVALLTLLAACGSNSGGSENGGAESDGSEATQAEATQPADDDGSDDDGSDDDGQAGSFDLDRAFEILTPPNATELSKTTAEGIIFAAWDVDDSFESLRSFYEDAIDEAGFQVVTTTEAQGGIAWAVADDDSSGIGGSISIFPASDGTGTQVSVTIGEGG